MGQQQLLLLVLCVVIVALAVTMGIDSFERNIEKETYDQMKSEAVRLAGEAIAWRHKPISMGGANPRYLTGLTFHALGYPTSGADPRDSHTDTYSRSIRLENTVRPQIEIQSVQHADLRVLLHMYGEETECLVIRQQRRVGDDWLDAEVPPQPSGCGGWSYSGSGGTGGEINVPTDPPPSP